MDNRLIKMADLLLDYSLEMKQGQTLLLSCSTIAEPIVQAMIEASAKRGVHLMTKLQVEDSQFLFFNNATNELLESLSPVELKMFEMIDGLVGFTGSTNSKELTRIPPEKIAIQRKARKVISDTIHSRHMDGTLNWCLAPFPTAGLASDAEMSLSEYSEFVFKACALDQDDPSAYWQKIHDEQEKIVEQFNGSKTLHIIGKDTDLTMSVDGRTWINCDGRLNMPDGEIFTSPVEDSAEGYIFFDYPACYGGVEVNKIKLELKGGKIINASAEKNEEYLLKMLDVDEGARLVGEIAIGTNYNITVPTKSILFDEKIGGSMHMAAGMSISEAGGKNQSGLHWDMVKDMRDGGRWELDGRVVYENGKFTI